MCVADDNGPIRDALSEIVHGVGHVGENEMAGAPGIFGAGDMAPSERTVTVAVGHGNNAARNADARLRSQSFTPALDPELALRAPTFDEVAQPG